MTSAFESDIWNVVFRTVDYKYGSQSDLLLRSWRWENFVFFQHEMCLKWKTVSCLVETINSLEAALLTETERCTSYWNKDVLNAFHVTNAVKWIAGKHSDVCGVLRRVVIWWHDERVQSWWIALKEPSRVWFHISSVRIGYFLLIFYQERLTLSHLHVV